MDLLLPDDILARIYGLLPGYRDRARMRCACRAFRSTLLPTPLDQNFKRLTGTLARSLTLFNSHREEEPPSVQVVLRLTPTKHYEIYSDDASWCVILSEKKCQTPWQDLYTTLNPKSGLRSLALNRDREAGLLPAVVVEEYWLTGICRVPKVVNVSCTYNGCSVLPAPVISRLHAAKQWTGAGWLCRVPVVKNAAGLNLT